MLLRWCLLLLVLAALGGCRESPLRIRSGGATFVEPLIQAWAAEKYRQSGLEVDYHRKGSGYGIQQMTERMLDFGCTDAPMSRTELQRAREIGGEILQIPITLSSVAVIYNLPNQEGNLVLSGPVLADIFLRKITRWNDPRIGMLNPRITFPNEAIVPVHRAESSGTTYLFTDYLAKASTGFPEEFAANKKPRWPEGGLAQEGSDGVIGHVRRNRYTIGYAEAISARRNGLPCASIPNRTGRPTLPITENVLSAAEHSPRGETLSMTDAPGEESYPIVGLSYAVFYRKQSRQIGTAIQDFFRWAVDDGQTQAESLGYVPLPQNLRSHAALDLQRMVLE